MERFAALGRMALTNYLMHSVVLTTIFYGYGFGLYGTIPRICQMLFVVAMVGFHSGSARSGCEITASARSSGYGDR